MRILKSTIYFGIYEDSQIRIFITKLDKYINWRYGINLKIKILTQIIIS